MRFPTMWYVRLAKTQTSLRIRAVWSEPLLVVCIFYDCKATDWTQFRVSKLNRRFHRLVWVYTCQNTTLLEITCRGSFAITSDSEQFCHRLDAFVWWFSALMYNGLINTFGHAKTDTIPQCLTHTPCECFPSNWQLSDIDQWYRCYAWSERIEPTASWFFRCLKYSCSSKLVMQNVYAMFKWRVHRHTNTVSPTIWVNPTNMANYINRS